MRGPPEPRQPRTVGLGNAIGVVILDQRHQDRLGLGALAQLEQQLPEQEPQFGRLRRGHGA
jgi:hypothetical protein